MCPSKQHNKSRNVKPQRKAPRRQKVKSAVIWFLAVLAALGLTGTLVYHGLGSYGHVHLPMAMVVVVLCVVGVALWKIAAIWLG